MPFSESTEPLIISIPTDDESGEPQPFRGVNKLVDPRRIADDELVDAQNVFPVTPEIINHRLALGSAGLINLNQNAFPIAASIVPFSGTYDFILARRNVGSAVQTNLQAMIIGAVLGNATDIGLGVTTRKPCFAFYNQTVIVGVGFPYSAHGGRQLSTGGFSAWDFTDFNGTALTPVANSCFSPQVCTPYKDRMVYANFGPGFESYLLFSDSKLQSSSSHPRQFVVTPTGGGLFDRAWVIGGQRDQDSIVGLKEIMLTQVGGNPQTALLVLKQYSAYLITGEPTQTGNTTDPVIGTTVVSKIAYNPGCASQETIVTTPYGTIWAGPDDVWMFQYGQAPMRIGSKIRSVLQRTPSNMRYRWHAEYFNGIYRLALDTVTNPIDDSPCGEQWWLDLRAGPPQGSVELEPHEQAMWWGPQIYRFAVTDTPTYQVGTRNMSVDTRTANINGAPIPTLYGIEFGVNSSNPIMSAVRYDVAGLRDNVSDNTLSPSSLDTTEIKADITTREYDLADARAEKLIQGLEASINVVSDSIIKSDFIVDTAVAETINLEVAGIDQIVNINPNPIVVTRKMQGKQWFPTIRDLGKTFQFRIYDPTGVAIVKGSNDTFILVYPYPFNTVYFVVTIADGLYPSVQSVLNAIVAALTATTGIEFNSGVSGGKFTITGGVFPNEFVVVLNPSFLATVTPGPGQPNPVPPVSFISTTKLMNMMGWNTPNGTGGSSKISTSRVLTADNIVPTAVPQSWQIGGLACNVLPMPRRPT